MFVIKSVIFNLDENILYSGEVSLSQNKLAGKWLKVLIGKKGHQGKGGYFGTGG
jgi:hypothetical protein